MASLPGCALVDADRRDLERGRGAVDEHEPRSLFSQAGVVPVVGAHVGDLARDEDHPFDPPLHQLVDVFRLTERRSRGVAEDGRVAGAGGLLLHRERERGEDRVAELRNEQADDPARGRLSRHVQELAHSTLDALPGRRADARCPGR